MCLNKIAPRQEKKLTPFLFSFLFLCLSPTPPDPPRTYLSNQPQVIDHAFLFVPAQAYVAKMIASLKEFPARQEPASFSIDRVMEKLKAGMPVT